MPFAANISSLVSQRYDLSQNFSEV